MLPFFVLQVLQKAYFMPESSTRKQVVFTYGQTTQLLDEMERKYFSEWSQNLDVQYLKRLEQPLMVRCKDNSAKLDINFDKWVTQTQHGIHIKVYIDSVLHFILSSVYL